MQCTNRMSKKRVSYLFSLAAASVLAAALTGCGGSSGGGGTDTVGGGTTTVVTPPVTTPGAAVTVGSVAAPTGTSPVTLTALTVTQLAALTPAVAVGAVSVNSPPVVTFAVSDGAKTNNAIIGLGASTTASTATLPSLTYLRFAIAKLVPGKNGSQSKWVNYIVTTVPTYKSATDKTIVPAAPRSPTADREGTLVDNKNGTYTYTFARDITKAKEIVDGATLTAPNVAADLGDLTFEPTLPHRLAIQLSGVGTPVNAIYDFIPSTGKAIAAADLTRDVVATANCNECHQALTLHGSRIETKYCVVCHTDQLKYGNTNVASTAGAFPALKETATVDATTGITSYTYAPATNIADGEVVGDFTVMIHKIHNGAELVKQNYNFANVAFNNKGYSMIGGGQKMCSKCHDNTKATNADNWNKAPTRLACGACHDGIKWSDGSGTTLLGAATGHVGKAQSSDATCALCHAAADIKVYHRTENVTPHNPTIAPGLVTFTYEIASADVNASNDLAIKFRINSATADANGVLGTATPVKFVAAAAGLANPLSGFTGAPAFLLAYATDASATDGIAAPIDYNNTGVAQAQAPSLSLANLLNTSNANYANQSLSGPDASGYYTATYKGTGTVKFPVGAKLRTVGLQGYFTQVSPAFARHAVAVVKTVTNDTARRTVVDKEKCANCHEWFEGHGGNRVKETQVCVMCHVPGLATSGRGATAAQLKAFAWTTADKKKLTGWGIDSTTFGAGTDDALKYPVTTNDFKDMIHGIHAGRDRVTPFKDARNRGGTQTLLDMRRMDFPGVLKNCETCHVAGTYSNVPATALASTYEHINAAYAAAKTQVNALASISATSVSGTDTVTSPYAAACVSCHDSVSAQGHMATQGGMIQVTRSTFMTNMTTAGKGEACATCHGTGKAEDIAVKHQ